jgi:hypothetical protein
VPSLGPEQGVKRLNFTLPLTGLPLPPRDAAVAPLDMNPVAESTLGEGHLYLAPPRFHPERGYKNMWRSEVLLRSPEPISEERQWVTTQVVWSFDRSGASASTGMGSPSSPWREDGTLLAPNEQLWYVTPYFENTAAVEGQPKLTVESKWKEVQRSKFTLDFQKLPVPEPGKILTPGTKFAAGDWGEFVVRKIAYFDEANTFSPRLASRYTMFQPPYGLAVVIEYVPSANAPKPVWGNSLHARTWDFEKAKAQDENGRSLARICEPPDGRNEPSADDLDALLPPTGTGPNEFNEKHATKNGYFFTTYLLPPTANAKSFNLQINATAEKILRTQTVTWRDIAVPLPPAPAANG